MLKDGGHDSKQLFPVQQTHYIAIEKIVGVENLSSFDTDNSIQTVLFELNHIITNTVNLLTSSLS